MKDCRHCQNVGQRVRDAFQAKEVSFLFAAALHAVRVATDGGTHSGPEIDAARSAIAGLLMAYEPVSRALMIQDAFEKMKIQVDLECHHGQGLTVLQ